MDGESKQASDATKAKPGVSDGGFPAMQSPGFVIARRATDLIAISLILMIGLTAGREVILWWKADASKVDAPSGDPLTEWSERPLEIQFGESASYARLPFRGQTDDAIAELVRQVSSRLAAADSLPPQTDDEQAWVESLARLTPVESTESGVKIYVVPGIVPTAAATILVSDETVRLAGWGMALPAGDDSWTLLVFSTTQNQAISALDGIRLPAQAATLFGWTDDRGQGVLAFRGQSRIADWLAHFDAEFGRRDSSFNSPDATAAQGRWRHGGRQIEIQFSAAGEEITALLWMTTASSGQNTTR